MVRTTIGQHGQWVDAFDHQHNVANLATNAEVYSGFVVPRWPTRTTNSGPVPTLNALHMALIPVGAHRGKAIAWGRGSIVGNANPFHPGGWNFQEYSIVDPAPLPLPTGQFRFLNFLLPLQEIPNPVPPLNPEILADLFCAAHAWSPFGYLVIAGGTRYTGIDSGADSVWTFDPRSSDTPWLVNATTGLPIYASTGGRWLEQPRLQTRRYYATATAMQRVKRTVSGQPNVDVDVMVVLGGSLKGSIQGPEWNHYEALQMFDDPLNFGAVVAPDDVGGVKQWWGPGDMNVAQPNPFWDWLLEYPRAHLVAGRIFVGGYAPRSARLDHTFDPATPALEIPRDQALPWDQRWNLASGTPIATSHYREAGSSVLFVNYPGYSNLVLRIGGEDENENARNTVERCLASTPGANGNWAPWSPMILRREHCNAVILPDASVLVVGGNDGPVSHTAPELYRFGVGWIKQPHAATRRNYHATALLLPDGRVLVAGGNDRHDVPGGFDYEVFSPPYLAGGAPRPESLIINGATGFALDTYELARNGTYTLIAQDMPVEAQLHKVVLLSPGSVTHHSDMHQRYVECTITSVVADSTLQFTLPSEIDAPRGYYMAFGVTSAGIPSPAIWVRLL